MRKTLTVPALPAQMTRKTGAHFVGDARGERQAIRKGSAMHALAVLLNRKQGATLEELTICNDARGSESTVGQHVQHIRYKGYGIRSDDKGERFYLVGKLLEK